MPVADRCPRAGVPAARRGFKRLRLKRGPRGCRGERAATGELVPVRAGPRRQAVTATAVRGLSRFAEARGVPPGGEFLLDYDVIEAFCVTGLRGRTCSARGHVPAGAVPARRSGARAAGAAGDAVPGREGTGAVLAGGAGRTGRGRSRAA